LHSPPYPRRPIGAHAPYTGGKAASALRHAAATASEVIQIFAGNPRGWARPRTDPAQDAALREQAGAAGMPVFVHAPYLINVGSPDPLLAERSAGALRHALRRAREIGARGVVVHTGSATDGDRDAGLRRSARLLLPLLDDLDRDSGTAGPCLLLEPMAGQGHMLCGALVELEPYLDALRWHPRAAVCLDTCHAFAAGHDLAADGSGVGPMLAALRAATRDPGGRLRLVHANDSTDPCGSRRDHHANIGEGAIGLAPFRELLAHPMTEGVPFVVETPGGVRGHAADVAALRALRGSPR